MTPEQFIKETKQIMMYKAVWGDKTKWFQRPGNIIPWIAKQAMLEIFRQLDEELGELSDIGYHGEDIVTTVWFYWLRCKDIFIEDIKAHNVEYAQNHLRKYFETGSYQG